MSIKRRLRMTGDALYNIVIATILVSTILSTIVLSILIHRLEHLHSAPMQLSARVEYMAIIEKKIYKQVIDEAMTFAPKGKSIYQLRGDAQTEAQRILDRLTKHYRVPRYILPAIMFKGILQSSGDAGAASECEDPIRYIFLNEILYLRNYEEFFDMIIPHEVAHTFVCLRGGYKEFSHGSEWKLVMRDLGFREPAKEIRHSFDIGPVYDYQRRLGEIFPSAHSGRLIIM